MDLGAFLIAWRTIALRDREVVDGLVHPAHATPAPSAPLAQALAAWPGTYYWSDEADGRHLILTRPARIGVRERWWLHLLLFMLTLGTTTYAGAVIKGVIPPPQGFGMFRVFIPVRADTILQFAKGILFSGPLLLILLCHELGHYFTARRYQLDTSPPFFIPLPIWPNFIGTMGAFIRLRTILSDRRQLFDVGIAGPIAGFVVALPLLALGLHWSYPAPPMVSTHGMIVWMGGEYYPLGDSLLTLALRQLLTPHFATVNLHPVAFAGWVGMFVTMLNLLPIAQLDGGHILYALLQRWQRAVAFSIWVGLLALGHWWAGWYLWAAVVLILSRGQLTHPPVLDAVRPLPRSRRWVALVGFVLFVLTFMPVPIHI